MTGKKITIIVNGDEKTADVTPRTSLADFLRDQLYLTGTHLGCEHGVCGACTINIDGEPARSCITFAVACDGSTVRTIEGFDHDLLMSKLRQAFTQHHALQCGYCTPGMLITARDIVLRLPNIEEERVRHELSGNLCRCTGYMGIVDAILDVQSKWDGGPDEIELQPAKSKIKTTKLENAGRDTITKQASNAKMTRLKQHFSVAYPRKKVWELFENLPEVATCMPGASLTGNPVDGHIQGSIKIKMGLIRAEFAGEADVASDVSNFTGFIRGMGLDKDHGSRAYGEVTYVLTETAAQQSTRVDIAIAFSLSGPLAQFSRAGIVNSFAEQLTKAFATNLETKISGDVGSDGELDIKSLAVAVFKNYFLRLLGSSKYK